ncbi:brevican core protein isoform X2 [Ornithorhynchus anatinus]|uniref:brevican core protein isoform X2 n=1 Tax=Ornithorhynchus anatinus TaxID=9258 RepID=UPI0010A79C74|nr:brevican core protein isoform X2 [Ornithorhynchus anatinus]
MSRLSLPSLLWTTLVLTTALTAAVPVDGSAGDSRGLRVTIAAVGPLRPPLAGSVSIPCHITYLQLPPPAPASGRSPRVKWTFLSGGRETEILVARGVKVKVSEPYRRRVALPGYPADPTDASLTLSHLRTNDSGLYRCQVQHGLDDGRDAIEVKVKGVVFLYREGTARYAFSFSAARDACVRIGAAIATPDQLRAAYWGGFEQCDAGWLADRTVRYPIQTPREACFGDMDGVPGIRNYGTVDPEELYDVYCYAEDLQGELFLGAPPQKLTLAEARRYCRARGAAIATTGQLFAAWSGGLDRCRPGWLADGSVRYPIVSPRERCGGGARPGVQTVFLFPNQTGFPDARSRFDVYCFRESVRSPTAEPRDLEASDGAGLAELVTVSDELAELTLPGPQGEAESRGAIYSIPLPFPLPDPTEPPGNPADALDAHRTAEPYTDQPAALTADPADPTPEERPDPHHHHHHQHQDARGTPPGAAELGLEPTAAAVTAGEGPDGPQDGEEDEEEGRGAESSPELPPTGGCEPNPCQNGGTCYEDPGADRGAGGAGISCVCLPGYGGSVCELELARCGPGWDSFQSGCYRHFPVRRAWAEAENQCRRLGAHLARIGTAEEQRFVHERYPEYQWIGLNDRTIEGDFQWSDGTPLLYENWQAGQPDSYFLSGEDCVVLAWHDGGRWSDVPCNYHLPFTCRASLVTCGPPPELATAVLTSRPQQRYAVGAVVRYRCRSGLSQRNAPLVACRPDGRWEAPKITCRAPGPQVPKDSEEWPSGGGCWASGGRC